MQPVASAKPETAAAPTILAQSAALVEPTLPTVGDNDIFQESEPGAESGKISYVEIHYPDFVADAGIYNGHVCIA